MKSVNKYLIALSALAAGMLGFTGCQNDFENNTPTFAEPVATLQANTTIAEFKQAFWKTDLSYVEEVGTKEDGSHYIIKGRVVTSDKPGNVYKNLVIQDETAAITVSINQNALYLDYRIGQEVVMDVTGMNIGKYCGLMQLGDPQYNEQYSQWQCTFMTYATFQEHTELNGFPRPSAPEAQPVVVKDFASLPSDLTLPEVAVWQSRLVRFNNVEFVFGGKEKFCDEKSVTTSRDLRDANGQVITVRTSGYANFYGHMLPEGRGDIIGILGFYQTSTDSSSSPWQITLIDEADCLNFGNPTMLPGDETNPYTVDQVTEIVRDGGTASGWVTGVIVGAVYGEVTTITSNSDIQWGAPAEMNNTIVLAPTPECTNIDECLVVQLPADSKMRQYANLRDNPDNYKKQMWLNGRFETYMGKCGVTGSTGNANTFKIEGVTVDGGSASEGTGTKEAPFNCSQVLMGTATGSDVWTVGYIVGWIDGKTLADGATFNASATVQTNLLIAATQGETDVNKCIPVQLPAGAVRSALNLQSNPGNFGKEVKLRGSLEKYFGANGIKTVSEYELSGAGTTPDTPDQPGTGNGTGIEADPYNIAKAIEIFNSGTVTTGWVSCYIVGSVPDKVYQEAVFGAANASATNIVVAASASETDLNKCMPVQLPTGAVRAALNLQDNAGLVGQQVLLYGSIEKYFGVAGIKSVTEYRLGGGSTPDVPDTPDTPSEGLGTQAAPLSVGDFMTQFNAGKTGDSWVEGYIVGFIPGKVYTDGVFTAEGAVATNFILAASASENDLNKCIAVQLPAGALRDALNLQANPGNLGRKVVLNGSMEKYFSVAGLKSVKAYEFK